MFSRTVRFAAILLTLAQLGVWGFYAPAHRLWHHSHLLTARTESAPGATCNSKRCSHHHSHSHSKPASTCPDHDHSSQCPDDDNQCSLCLIALHSGCLTDATTLDGFATQVSPIAETPQPLVASPDIRLFDSRGPPAV